MTLTGQGLIIVLVAVTLLVPLAGVLVWPRVRGGRVLAGMQRTAIVLVSQLAALVLLAAIVNDYGYFYTSWGQVQGALSQALGLDATGGSTVRTAADTAPRTGRPLPNTENPASAGWVHVLSHSGTPALWQHDGRIDSVTLFGAVSGLREHAYVYLPPQYFDPGQSTARFPAVEVLTGYPGNDISLLSRLPYPSTVRTLIRSGQMRPTVLVMMRPSPVFPRDTECSDVPGGPQALTYLAADVPAQIAHAYRVQPTQWGSMGDSTGGYCATKLAMTHPLLFPAAVSLSGYYFALHDNTTGDLWGGSTTVRHTNDLFWRMQHLPPPPISILIATARTEKGDDGFAQAVAFSKVVRAPTKASMLIESTGGHNFTTWTKELAPGMRWLNSRIGENA